MVQTFKGGSQSNSFLTKEHEVVNWQIERKRKLFFLQNVLLFGFTLARIVDHFAV